MVVVSRNPVYSVLFLILAFFNAAALFVLIGAEFIAMILVIVYVGAVAVLFLFVVMMVGIFVSRGLGSVVNKALERVTGNQQVSFLLSRLTSVAVVSLSLFVALGLLELDKTVTSLLAGVGVVGLALGFAFQDIAANFMSGFLMALNRPFEVGDLVEVAGQRGRIKSVSLRASEIETLQGLTVLVPNKDVYQNAITNYTTTPHRRLDLAVGTGYGDDMETVRSVVKKALQHTPHRDADRDVELFFEAFGDSSINFSARVWLTQSEESIYLEARSEAMIAIKKALDAANLTIPFPIRTLDFGAAASGGEGLGSVPIQLIRSGEK
jgi:small conductance mechanosensitive channel